MFQQFNNPEKVWQVRREYWALAKNASKPATPRVDCSLAAVDAKVWRENGKNSIYGNIINFFKNSETVSIGQEIDANRALKLS